jgi:hypothetical protein
MSPQLDIVQSQARAETAMDVTEPKDASGADAPTAAMETTSAPATQAPGEEKTGVSRPVAAFLDVAQADTVDDSALAKQPGEERQEDGSAQQDGHTAVESGNAEPAGAERVENTKGELVAEGGERERLRRTGDSDAELAGTTTAGVIEDALIETGLVAEGEAAGVEAKALARVVAFDEMETREAGAVDVRKEEAGKEGSADQQGEQGALGATGIDEVGSREEETPASGGDHRSNEDEAADGDKRETEKESDPLEEKAEGEQSKDLEPGPVTEEGKDGRAGVGDKPDGEGS